MTQPKTIRWGVLTAGRITHTFASDIQYCQNTTIHAVAARRLANAREFAEQYGIPNAYEGYQALYDDPHIDAIYIASPHTLHLEHAKAALEAGKHVLCEKPITTSVEDMQTLIECAKRNQCFLMEAMWTYFLPAIQQAQKWLQGGEIGELLQVRADFGYPLPYAPDRREYDAQFAGGCLYEMGIYPIALNWLFHPVPCEREHVHGHLAPNGVDDDVVWQWDYDASSASLHTSFRAKLPNTAYLIGSKGTIEIPEFFRARSCLLYELDHPKLTFEDHRQGSGFEFEILHACEAIRQGKLESDVVSWKDSLAFQAQIAHVRKASGVKV